MNPNQRSTASQNAFPLSRRSFLGGAALATTPALLPRMSFARSAAQADTLVSIFLRGAMDGLTLCVPYGDSDLYVARPTLAIAPPGQPNGAIDLDGFFGLAPAAAPLLGAFQSGDLLFVHASGSPDPSRSHFDAQRFMETGTPLQPTTSVNTGWLGRYLQGASPLAGGQFRAMGVGARLPRTLNGAPGTLPISDPSNFLFPGEALTAAQRRLAIEEMYAPAAEPLASAADNTLASIDILATIDFAGYQPENGAQYPATTFGTQLRNTAAAIKAGVGLEAVHLDLGGWDHHSAMGPLNGSLANLLDELTSALGAFYLDMQLYWGRLVLVCMTEFGRRIRENGSAGADHGHGGCMLVMGGHIAGGQVYTNPWPGLDTSSGSGDLEVTTDYRDILAEILAERLGATNLGEVFPNYTPVFRGLVN